MFINKSGRCSNQTTFPLLKTIINELKRGFLLSLQPRLTGRSASLSRPRVAHVLCTCSRTSFVLWSQTWQETKIDHYSCSEDRNFLHLIPLSSVTSTDSAPQDFDSSCVCVCVCPLTDEPYSKRVLYQISGSQGAVCMLIPKQNVIWNSPIANSLLLRFHHSSLCGSTWLQDTEELEMEGKWKCRHHERLVTPHILLWHFHKLSENFISWVPGSVTLNFRFCVAIFKINLVTFMKFSINKKLKKHDCCLWLGLILQQT